MAAQVNELLLARQSNALEDACRATINATVGSLSLYRNSGVEVSRYLYHHLIADLRDSVDILESGVRDLSGQPAPDSKHDIHRAAEALLKACEASGTHPSTLLEGTWFKRTVAEKFGGVKRKHGDSSDGDDEKKTDEDQQPPRKSARKSAPSGPQKPPAAAAAAASAVTDSKSDSDPDGTESDEDKVVIPSGIFVDDKCRCATCGLQWRTDRGGVKREDVTLKLQRCYYCMDAGLCSHECAIVHHDSGNCTFSCAGRDVNFKRRICWMASLTEDEYTKLYTTRTSVDSFSVVAAAKSAVVIVPAAAAAASIE